MSHPSPMSSAEATAAAHAVLDAVETAVVGKRESLELVLTGILAGGHVLLEDLPGLGKTLAARSFAQALGLEFTRAQFTPDLLPADLTGAEVFDQRNGEFAFRPGPVFTGLLLADEINRTPPKTQSALLEAMQERQVSVEGTTRPLPDPFHVLATANPVEHEGTYPLPEAQLDRFLLRLSFGYPTAEQEWEDVTPAAWTGAARSRPSARCSMPRPCAVSSRWWRTRTSTMRWATTWSSSSRRRGCTRTRSWAPPRAAPSH